MGRVVHRRVWVVAGATPPAFAENYADAMDQLRRRAGVAMDIPDRPQFGWNDRDGYVAFVHYLIWEQVDDDGAPAVEE